MSTLLQRASDAAEAAQRAASSLLGEDHTFRKEDAQDYSLFGETISNYEVALPLEGQHEQQAARSADAAGDPMDAQVAAEIGDEAVLAELKRTMAVALNQRKDALDVETKRSAGPETCPSKVSEFVDDGVALEVDDSGQDSAAAGSGRLGEGDLPWAVFWDAVSCPPTWGDGRSISMMSLAQQLAAHVRSAQGGGPSELCMFLAKVYLGKSSVADGCEVDRVDPVRRGEMAEVNRLLGGMPRLVPVTAAPRGQAELCTTGIMLTDIFTHAIDHGQGKSRLLVVSRLPSLLDHAVRQLTERGFHVVPYTPLPEESDGKEYSPPAMSEEPAKVVVRATAAKLSKSSLEAKSTATPVPSPSGEDTMANTGGDPSSSQEGITAAHAEAKVQVHVHVDVHVLGFSLHGEPEASELRLTDQAKQEIDALTTAALSHARAEMAEAAERRAEAERIMAEAAQLRLATQIEVEAQVSPTAMRRTAGIRCMRRMHDPARVHYVKAAVAQARAEMAEQVANEVALAVSDATKHVLAAGGELAAIVASSMPSSGSYQATAGADSILSRTSEDASNNKRVVSETMREEAAKAVALLAANGDNSQQVIDLAKAVEAVTLLGATLFPELS
ncbi:hypothetical protein AB1Y20_015155 [Prymnesium parvum]|uniref:Uncharacterized protein n=1 Tax=Prymnesium parvum TaxID=97485 RepID=A0AB34JW88_PRYPA